MNLIWKGPVFKEGMDLPKTFPIFDATFGHCPDCGHEFKYFPVMDNQECPHCHGYRVISHYPVGGHANA